MINNSLFYNRRDQQFIARKYDGGHERVTLELVPDIILEEKEDGFYQWADNYDQWDNNPYIPVERDEIGGSYTFNIDNSIFTITKTKRNGKLKSRVVSEMSESNNKSDFYICKRPS